jgi:hypothetical protein
MTQWTKEPAIESGGIVCLCCGTPTQLFPAEGVIAVGFGSASVTCDGRSVYDEQQVRHDNEYWTGADAEKAAEADPDHDWRITKYAPLYEAEYQRHGPGQWVMIRRGEGFA